MDNINEMFFLKKNCTYSSINNYVILSNEYKSSSIKIPIEFFELLNYSYENRLKIKDIMLYIGEDLKKSFIELLMSLKKMELLNRKYDYNFNLEYIPKIVISVTNKCNLKCSYCCMDSDIGEINISSDKLKKIFDFAIKLNPEFINISGGEPLLRKNIINELSYLREKYDGNINLSTNAIYINEKNIELLLPSIDQIMITLDGYNEETCSKIRNKKTFNKIVKSIELIKKYKFKKIICSMVVGENTYKYKDKFIEFCESMNVKYTFNYFMRIGRGNACKEFLNNSNYIDYIDKNENLFNYGVNSCRAGESQLFINNNADVYPCPLLMDKEYFIGNIFQDEKLVEKIINQDEKYKRVCKNLDLNRSAKNIQCKDCKYKLYCIKCMYVMDRMRKNKKIFEANCLRRKKIFENNEKL